MIFFWLFYFFINFLISFSVFKILNNKFLGIVLAFLVFGTLSGIWFIYPGSQNLAPIVSIFFLENDKSGLQIFLDSLTDISFMHERPIGDEPRNRRKKNVSI